MYTMAIILSSLIIIFILMFIIGCCCKDQDIMEGLQMTGFFGLIGCLLLSALPGVWFRYETKDIWHQVEKNILENIMLVICFPVLQLRIIMYI